MANQQLYLEMKRLLQNAYQGQNQQVADHLLKRLAMRVTGVLLGPHVQLYAIAMCVPVSIKLPSLVRRFSGFVADSRVDAQALFAPFVYAMQATLCTEKVYLVMDCTKVGPKCRVLVIAWSIMAPSYRLSGKPSKGKKGMSKVNFKKHCWKKCIPTLMVTAR